MLWKVYGPLWYLAVPYGALRCAAEMLRKACGPLRCLAVHCGTVQKRCGRVATVDHRCASQCIVVRCICCGRLPHHCDTLQCLMVRCIYVTEGLWATVVPCGAFWYSAETLSKGCEPSQCIAVCCICCGRLTDCYGTLHCLTMRCGALRKCCRRLVDHCGALWCGVYVVDNSTHHYGTLECLTLPCGALHSTAETLQKASGPLR